MRETGNGPRATVATVTGLRKVSGDERRVRDGRSHIRGSPAEIRCQSRGENSIRPSREQKEKVLGWKDSVSTRLELEVLS